MRGRRIALSPPRLLLTDLSHLSRGFPRATLLTRINVAALVEPRDQARIPWPVVFAKAYALVAAGSPRAPDLNLRCRVPGAEVNANR